jgi:hypothetical protein
VNLPLDTKLDPKSAGGELAERVWDNPEWNKQSDEADENAKKEDWLGPKWVQIEEYSHDREAATDVLTH